MVLDVAGLVATLLIAIPLLGPPSVRYKKRLEGTDVNGAGLWVWALGDIRLKKWFNRQALQHVVLLMFGIGTELGVVRVGWLGFVLDPPSQTSGGGTALWRPDSSAS